MGNKIEKIIVSHENQDIDLIVVVREKTFEEYSKFDYTNDDLKKIYQKAIRNLQLANFKDCVNMPSDSDIVLELEKKGLISFNPNNLDEELEELRNNKKEKTGIKNLKVSSNAKRILAGAVILATVTGIGVGIVSLVNKNNKKTEQGEKYPTFEDSMPTPTPSATPTPTSTVMVTPTPKPTEMPISYQQPNEEFLQDVTYDGITSLHENEDGLTKDNYIRLSYINVEDLGNHIQNPDNNSLTQDPIYIDFGSFFDEGSKDKAFVDYFNKYRNEIIYRAYENRNSDYALNYIYWGNYEIVRCIGNNGPIQAMINGKLEDVFYDDLSLEAKEYVLQIADGIRVTFSKRGENFVEYDGVLYDQNAIGEIVVDAYENLQKTK